MAKRTRYPKRPAPKPGARRVHRAAGSESRLPAPAPSPADGPLPVDLADEEPIRASSASLTEAELKRAEELEAEATAKERAAIAESLRRRNRAAAGDESPAWGDVNAPLSVRAAHEYAYVARDVRRIAVTAGVMVGILALLHVLVNVLGIITF